tara:strand:+ start:1564 stop:1797 length:234 start_codon:yes stop_codon:yes gene_type:complete
MKAIFFIVILQLHSGDYHTTTINVETCPPREAVEAAYARHQANGRFLRWAALCTTVDFSKRIAPKKDTPKPDEKIKV